MRLYFIIFINLFLLSSCSNEAINPPQPNPIANKSPNSARIQNTISHIDGLYLGKTLSKNNEILYLACESIDASNQQFWKAYLREANMVARYFEFASGALSPSEKAKLAYNGKEYAWVKDILGYDEKKYNDILSYIDNENERRKGPELMGTYFQRLFTDIKNGLAGFSFVPEPGLLSKLAHDHYVVYGSNTPITRKKRNEDYSKGASFSTNFGSILISFGLFDYKNLPVVTHYGIQRNVEYFLTPIVSYPELSLVAHGFGAWVSRHVLKDKKYMSTSPIGKMSEILKSKLKPESIFVNRFPDDVQKLIDEEKWALPTMGNEKITVELGELEKLYVPEVVP